ncbi:MAG TPA: glycosyltransferase family 1 protein [Chloroflexi bacterium]|nr:glycosyltransferase family 1 protein [Chloroflexota bacterium]
MLSVHTCPLATLGGKKTGGMNVYVRELSRELSERGIRVDVFTRSQDPCVPHVNDSALGEKARVIHIPTGPERPLPTAEVYPHLPRFVEGVQAFAREEGLHYDLLHSHYWLSGWAALELRKSWHVPVIQMFHTLGRMKNRIAQDEAERESELRLEVEDRLIREADYLVAATPAERVQLLWLYDADMHRIRVIPPGVNLKHFHPIPQQEALRKIGVPEAGRMLLFVGRIEPLKGIDTLMRAISILKQEAPHLVENLCVSIIGGAASGDESPPDREMLRLKQLREALGLDDLVTFLGSKSQETLQYYYSAAEAVIMPSHYESFGMVALEAAACGTPVIASEVGGLAYLIQDGVTGFHVPTNDPAELAGKICLLLENEDLRREMSAAAIRRAREYAWPRIADQIQQLYLECVKDSRRQRASG